MSETVRVGSRRSRLARLQTESVIKRLSESHPEVRFELEIIQTKGDKLLDSSLATIGGKGVFTREIELALLDGRIDLAVHSYKDLPTELPEGLAVGAVPQREDARDVLVSKGGLQLNEMPQGAVLLTGSLRRKVQLLNLRPDAVVEDVRGNVPTRLEKFASGGYDGIVLAAAGLRRLDLIHLASELFAFESMLPAVGQGALAIEIREDDAKTAALLRSIADHESSAAVEAERSLLKELEGGCQVPLGAHGQVQNGTLTLDAVVASLDGKTLVRGSSAGETTAAQEIGVRLAERLLDDGARAILREVKRLREELSLAEQPEA